MCRRTRWVVAPAFGVDQLGIYGRAGIPNVSFTPRVVLALALLIGSLGRSSFTFWNLRTVMRFLCGHEALSFRRQFEIPRFQARVEPLGLDSGIAEWACLKETRKRREMVIGGSLRSGVAG